jgi:hypothetical protein
MAEYPPPVDRLLTRGEPNWDAPWPNYVEELGLRPEFVPELVRMMQDPELFQADYESTQVWAPMHAWRALGQLRAESAIEPLLQVVDRQEDEYDEGIQEDFPEVFALIGPPAVPALTTYLADPSRADYAKRGLAAASLTEIAKKHPDQRAACVAAMTRSLEQAEQNDPSVNGWIVSNLIDLKATEAAPAIEHAFAVGAVDDSITGSLDWVKYDMGLSEQPPAERRYRFLDLPPPGDLGRTPNTKAKARAKARRKQADKSRKRNRKKKRR